MNPSYYNEYIGQLSAYILILIAFIWNKSPEQKRDHPGFDGTASLKCFIKYQSKLKAGYLKLES